MIAVMIFLVDKTESFCPTCDIGEVRKGEELRSKANPQEQRLSGQSLVYLSFFYSSLYL